MGPINFVGIKNFITIFTDERFTPTFFNAIKNNLKYLLCVWLIITPFQYLVAYVLYIKIPAHKYIKFMIFLPYVISSTIVSFFATLVFDPNIGFLNNVLKDLGMKPGAWFGDPNWAFKLLILLVIWQGAGSGIMIFYSNFMDISQDVMEASRVDGMYRMAEVLAYSPSIVFALLCVQYYHEYQSGHLQFLIFRLF